MLYLPVGQNHLETPQGQSIQFITYPGNSGGIINPSRARYYSYTIYGDEMLHSPMFNSLVKQFEFDGHYYQGPLRTSNAELIDNNIFKCRYPGEVADVKAELESYVAGKKGMLTICFNEPEFRQFLEYHPRGVRLLPESTIITPDQDAEVTFTYRLRDFNFADPQLQQGEKEIAAILTEYQHQRDVNKKHDIYNRYHTVLMSMAQHYRQATLRREKDNTAEKEESRKFSDFIQESGEIFGAGILPLTEDDLPPAH
ncbi:hypothetical protein [Morganella psychrotolerans]|uniref:hypothetical protein n=1 Tax=Morganella psychrotolerans TaxID=368603 RepID=UPI0039AF197F